MKKEPSQEIGLIGGIENRQIEVLDYDPGWPDEFKKHQSAIARALGEVALRIEHIGSTAVPGLAAKPIVDILVEVADSSNESLYLPQLEEAGYELRVREPDWHEHRMFRTPERTTHIHIYSTGCPEILRNLTFRDYLRRSVEDRMRYEKVKLALAAKEWADMNAYSNAKTEVIESILATARGSKAP